MQLSAAAAPPSAASATAALPHRRHASEQSVNVPQPVLRFERHRGKAFAADEASLRHFAVNETGRNREWLLTLADEVEAKRRVALTACDSAPLWRSEHPACDWLGKGFFGSGLLAQAVRERLRRDQATASPHIV